MTTTLANAKGIFTDTRKLHVVDFGSGAFAMQFGVALVAADAIRNGQTIDEIHIDSLDLSTDMTSIGEKAWERFALFAEDDTNLAELNKACNAIDSRINDLRCQLKDDTVHWPSAMHTSSPNQSSLFDAYSEVYPALPRPTRVGETEVSYKSAREVLTKSTGFMGAYDFTLNSYSGCSFGCTYCYAAFFNCDVGKRDSWGKWVTAKENAIALLDKHKPGALDGKMIYMSSITDPYQPIEKELRITRGLLELVAERHKLKLVVQTRSPLVVKNCDLFRRIEDNGGRVQVNMTVTTDDEELRRTFEPFCPSNPRRLAAIKEVQDTGIATCITMTPLLLVSNSEGFADELIDTGVKKFIAQPFHFVRGRFVASTRDVALNLMAEKRGCDRSHFWEEYLKRYKEFFAVLNNKLLDNGLTKLGEGKDGFAPPF